MWPVAPIRSQPCRRNTRSLGRYRLIPRVLRDVSERDLSVELFGRRLPAPLLLAPIGVLSVALSKVKFNNANIVVVAISVAVGLLPTVNSDIYAKFPSAFQIIFNSGISAGALTAIILNLVFNSRTVQQKMDSGDPDLSAHDAVRGAAPNPASH